MRLAILIFPVLVASAFGQIAKKPSSIVLDQWWNIDYLKDGCELAARNATPCSRSPEETVREFEAELKVAFASELACRYAADSDGRLHPLYDVLQVAERLYGTRRKAALELKIADIDLSDLGRISNDPTVLNGRHPGKTQGPHRIASEAEVNTCERVARTIIENHASKIVIWQPCASPKR